MSELTGDIGEWIGGGALVLLGAWSLSFVPRMWRDAAYVERIRELGSFLGDRAGGALAGVAPVGAAGSFLVGLMLLVALLERSTLGSPSVLGGARIALVVAVIALILLGFVVFLFGRPSFLVPPAARPTSGLLVRHSDPP